MSANAHRTQRADLPTVMRLLGGLVRRNRRIFLIWVWLLPNLLKLLADNGGSVGWLMATSMTLAFVLGAQAGEGTGCREYRVLPVTGRDLWLTTWLNTTVVVPLILLMLKLLGLAYVAANSGNAFMTPETLLLSTLYDVSYAGALAWAMPRLPASTAVLRMGRPTLLPALVVMPLFFILAIGGPLFFARSLPTRVAEFSTPSTLALLLGLTMSVASLLAAPRKNTAAYAMWVRATAAPEPSPAPRRLADHFTGVLRIGWSHIVSVFVMVSVGYGAFLAAGPYVFPAPDGTNPRFLTGMFLVFTFMGISMFSIWTMWLRQLKVLPLSVSRVNALLVFTPFVTWAEAWLIVLLVHGVMGWPITEELSPLAIFAYAGLCAMTHALGFPFKGNVAGQTAASMIGSVAAATMAINLFAKPDSHTRLLVLAIGLASLGIAALINHYTLTRSTSSAMAYRPPRAI